MAHFAEIDSNNIVIRVLAVANEYEEVAQDYLSNQLGLGGTWIQTSYNKNFRAKFAGIGDVYDESDDTFKPSKPYDSWTWNHISWEWNAPVEHPNDGKWYDWDEDSLSWVEVTLPA